MIRIILNVLCYQDLARLARLSDTSELPVFPTHTPSPSSGPREESSREPEEEEPPEDTRNKPDYHIYLVIVVHENIVSDTTDQCKISDTMIHLSSRAGTSSSVT